MHMYSAASNPWSAMIPYSFCSFYSVTLETVKTFFFCVCGTFLYIYFWLEDNHFKLLCSSPPYNRGISHKYVHAPSLLNLPPTSPIHCPGHPRAPGWTPCTIKHLRTSRLCYTWWWMLQWYSLHSSHLLLPLLCPQAHPLCLCLVLALQTGSSVPFFWIPCVCVHIGKLLNHKGVQLGPCDDLEGWDGDRRLSRRG